jgi:dTDP-4-amino-4,6-dideoxygalactose transaminase
MQTIPFHISDIERKDISACISALSQNHLDGDGPETRRVQCQLKTLLNVPHVLLTPSCTHAMELALMSLGIGIGDEVILPSFTFSSTANAIVLQGARPVFAEIERETLMIDPNDIERRITNRTKAIMPVHYAGVSCPMDEVIEIANRHRLYVIEDAAQGVGAKYRGQFLGTIGDIGCYSFHGTKIVTCGEGGAFITKNDEIAKKAEIIREKGTNRSAFLRGEVDKYTWVDRGSSYVMADILAAILGEQLKKMEALIAARKRIFEIYMEGLRDLASSGRISLPTVPDYAESNYHIFYILTETENERNRLLEALRNQGIGSSFHYIPLHSSPFGMRFGYEANSLPITEHVSKTLVRFPIYPRLDATQMERIIDAVTLFFDPRNRVLRCGS